MPVHLRMRLQRESLAHGCATANSDTQTRSRTNQRPTSDVCGQASTPGAGAHPPSRLSNDDPLLIGSGRLGCSTGATVRSSQRSCRWKLSPRDDYTSRPGGAGRPGPPPSREPSTPMPRQDEQGDGIRRVRRIDPALVHREIVTAYDRVEIGRAVGEPLRPGVAVQPGDRQR